MVIDGVMEMGCLHRCGDCRDRKGECPFACPNNERRYVRMLQEVGKLGLPPTKQMHGPDPVRLPLVLPQLSHGSRRWKPLSVDCVTIPITELLARTPPDADGLKVREIFRLDEEARILALGVAQDHFLEDQWSTRAEVTRRLAAMELEAVSIPNFSIFSNAPRHQSMVSLTRMHRFCDVLSEAGLRLIPHIYAETDPDWERWAEILKNHPQASVIAMEFQTHLVHAEPARDYILRLGRLQTAVGRPLHILAVGGTRYLRELRTQFQERCTFTEADSFFKTMHRQDVGAETSSPTPIYTDLADLLDSHIARRKLRISRRFQSASLSVAA
jgi:hypothetical protein